MKHNSIALIRSIPPLRRTLSAISIALSLGFALAAFGLSVNTSWTYQGQLRRSGTAYNGTCNFQFSLWDAASAGTQQGSTQPINGVNVVNGLFTVTLDFGNQYAFDGEALWLATSVQCTGDGGFTALDPRQPITATPYAQSLRPGARIEGFVNGAVLAVENSNSSGYGIYASGDFRGVEGSSYAAAGGTGVYGSAYGLNAAGVYGVSGDSGKAGVLGYTSNTAGRGVEGQANGANAAGVFGLNSTGPGVWGRSTGAGAAVYGQNTSTGPGVTGSSQTGPGVTGSSTSSDGVAGYSDSLSGVYGQSNSGAGVFGRSNTGHAGFFDGRVHVQGELTKASGSFKIDHPLDPANKFLSHSFVESPDMMNIYNGNVTTDASGSATVTLPDYFAALNHDYRYQLTVVGQFAQAIVSRKVAGNSFEIRTDKPGVEVSWQVTGIRQDVYARENPIVPEQFKPAEQQGMYLYPAGFGAGEEKRLGQPSRPTAPETEQKVTKKTK